MWITIIWNFEITIHLVDALTACPSRNNGQAVRN